MRRLESREAPFSVSIGNAAASGTTAFAQCYGHRVYWLSLWPRWVIMLNVALQRLISFNRLLNKRSAGWMLSCLLKMAQDAIKTFQEGADLEPTHSLFSRFLLLRTCTRCLRTQLGSFSFVDAMINPGEVESYSFGVLVNYPLSTFPRWEPK